MVFKNENRFEFNKVRINLISYSVSIIFKIYKSFLFTNSSLVYVAIILNLRLIIRRIKIEKLTEKLEDWYLLDWSEFAGELKKKKITLSAKDEEKWLDRFERLRKEALAIKGVIDSTDKEIDQMVYELYGLTKDEIGIVEDTGK